MSLKYPRNPGRAIHKVLLKQKSKTRKETYESSEDNSANML